MMWPMKTAGWFRFVSVVLVAVLVLTLATPARAEAIEMFTILALVSVGVAVIILVTYLIVANVKGDKMRAESDAPAMVACIESDAAPRNCWPVASVQEAVEQAKRMVPGQPVTVSQAP